MSRWQFCHEKTHCEKLEKLHGTGKEGEQEASLQDLVPWINEGEGGGTSGERQRESKRGRQGGRELVFCSHNSGPAQWLLVIPHTELATEFECFTRVCVWGDVGGGCSAGTSASPTVQRHPIRLMSHSKWTVCIYGRIDGMLDGRMDGWTLLIPG